MGGERFQNRIVLDHICRAGRSVFFVEINILGLLLELKYMVRLIYQSENYWMILKESIGKAKKFWGEFYSFLAREVSGVKFSGLI